MMISLQNSWSLFSAKKKKKKEKIQATVFPLTLSIYIYIIYLCSNLILLLLETLCRVSLHTYVVCSTHFYLSIGWLRTV